MAKEQNLDEKLARIESRGDDHDQAGGGGT